MKDRTMGFMIASLQLQYAQSLPWVILLLAGLSLLILFTYRAQVRQLPPAKRWILPALRILAVSAVAMSILRPVVTRQRVSGERAPVVILLDDSRSMSVIDSARNPAELVGIAATLGKLPPDTRDKQLQAIGTECDLLSTRADDVARARSELDYARLSGRGEETARTRLDQAIADLQVTARSASSRISASMKNSSLERTLAYLSQAPAGSERQNWLDHVRERARGAAASAEQMRFSRDAELFRSNPQVREACQPLQTLDRLQLSESAVFDVGGGLLARLGAGTSVLGYGISDAVTPIPVASTEPPSLSADGSISNLTGGVRAVLDSLAVSPPRAVVLFSDGRQTGADPDTTAVAVHGVPVFTVDIASRSGIKDLTIENAFVPANAMVGETVSLRAEIRAPGFTGTTTTLTITGGGPDETRPITFTDDRPVSVQFNRRFTSAGVGHLALELGSVPGEMAYDNNHIDRWITVAPRSATRPADMARPATRPAIETEMADLTGDEGFLRRLAEATGGQFFRLDQLDLLAGKINQIHDDVNRPVEIPLWDGPYVLALVLGCLAAEWGLRKRFGLA